MDDQSGPRLRPATDDELSGTLRAKYDPLTRAFGHHSQLLEAWLEWYRPITQEGSISARLKEIVRLRVAQLNACNF